MIAGGPKTEKFYVEFPRSDLPVLAAYMDNLSGSEWSDLYRVYLVKPTVEGAVQLLRIADVYNFSVRPQTLEYLELLQELALPST